MWDFHVDDSAKGRYYVVLVRDILIALVLNMKFSEHIIKVDDGPLKVSTETMVDLGTYKFKDLNTRQITPE